MNTTIAKHQQDLVQPIRIIRIGKKVHVARSAHHLVRSQRQSTDQRGRILAANERGDGLPDLLD